jgi:arsenite methyltransferase
LRQIYRVLRRGGRLGLSTGCKDHPNQLQTIKARVLACEPYYRYAEASGGGTYRVSADELNGLLGETGFAVKKLEVRPHVHYHPSPDAAIEFAEASSFGNFLGHLPEELRPSAHDAIKRELEYLRTPEGIRREGARILAVALKP